MNWAPAYRARVTSAERAVNAIRSGDHVWIHAGCNNPEELVRAMVGRAEELRFLKEQFHATGREGRARLVSLVGQAGIGKSRLAWELEKYLDGLVENVWWHRGRSPSYGEGVTFWALTEMVRRRAGLPLRNLRHVLITHHHSDHDVDLGPLLQLAWLSGRVGPVDCWTRPGSG